MCEVPLADVSAFIFGAPPAFEAATDLQNNYVQFCSKHFYILCHISYYSAPPAFDAATDWQSIYFHLVFIDHPPHCIGAMFWEKSASYIIGYIFCFNPIAHYFCDL